MEIKKLAMEVLQNAGFEPALINEIVTAGRSKKVSAGEVLIDPKSQSDVMPLVLTGTLKILRQDKEGQEVFLYFLEGGETRAMSITCCLEGQRSAFVVVAEEDATLWMIPIHLLDEWIVAYRSFRRFVFSSYQTRFDELLNTIDSVVFLKMDQRLYKYLLDKKQASGSYVINKTHNQIANELNTSRVVVSRLLKQLEREGKIEQYRNRIEIL